MIENDIATLLRNRTDLNFTGKTGRQPDALIGKTEKISICSGTDKCTCSVAQERFNAVEPCKIGLK